MKPVDVKLKAYIVFKKENNDKDPKVGDPAIISKYKNFFAEGYVPNWSEENIKNIVPWVYVISDLNDKKIVGTFYEQ